MLRRIFGLPNEELHNLYSSPTIIRMIKLAAAILFFSEFEAKKKEAYYFSSVL
jgi:hypothetical protein